MEALDRGEKEDPLAAAFLDEILVGRYDSGHVGQPGSYISTICELR